MFKKIPLRHRWKWIRLFCKPEIYPEAYFAYLNKLPNEIQVKWFRDEGKIIGKVIAGNKEFMTKGTTVDEFIISINQSMIAAFNIPEDYVDIVSQTKTYTLKPSERKLLEDKNTAEHSFGLVKQEQSFQLA